MGNLDALLEADALAEDERESEGRGTGVDVDRGATGEVDRADSEPLLHAEGDPAAVREGSVLGEPEVEDPAGDREVDDRGPDGREDHPCAELRAVGDRAGDQRDGDDRERGLERDEGERRVRGALRRGQQAVEADLAEVDRPGELNGAGGRGRERHGIAVEHPQDADETHSAEAQHHHADDALGLDQSAVEERQPWRHEQNERGSYEDECGVALIHLGENLSAGTQETRRVRPL